MALQVKNLNITVFENIKEDAIKILSILRPSWKEGDIKFKIFTDGITNRLLGCQHKDDCSKTDMLLVRVYGEKTELIIDRDMELQNMQLMHLWDCAKPAYARFNNGIVYGFIPGECLDDNTVREPHIARLIAREMVKMQSVDVDSLSSTHPSLGQIDRKPCLFTKTRNYIDDVPDEFPDPDKNKRFQEDVMSKAELYSELQLLQRELEKLGSPVVFSHNDLLLKNIVFSKEEDNEIVDEGEKMANAVTMGLALTVTSADRTYFIDFEYGGFNYEAYDIGNHFCEYAGLETVDYSLYPSKDYQMGWLRNFLEFKFQREGKSPEEITEVEVERLYVQANKFALMAHFFWGVWGLIQARHSTIDFDYLDYAVQRFNEYKARKQEFLSLQMP